jgi:diacylglycerol kinase family enzyme
MRQRTASPRPTARQRAAAFAALLIGAVVIALLVDVVFGELLRGLAAVACLALAVAAMWFGLVRRGAARALGWAAAVAAVAGMTVLLIGEHFGHTAVLVGGLVLTAAATAAAFRIHVRLDDAEPPSRPVLFFNPKSGGGKAERFSLADAARERGIEPVELKLGQDLERLVRDAVAGGADGLAMAGGDGSQAIVAAVASDLDLPYACIPAGTRNHFALDLGVDREDVVGALDAFVDGGERRVDLADVNGRVFVNNVSLGVYAEAVQQSGYRDAKVKTLLDTFADSVGPDGEGLDMRWQGPGGREHSSGAAILVSNNRYRLGPAVGSGTRPRIDDGLLGITVLSAPTGRGGIAEAQRPWRDWSSPAFEVDADGPVHAGIDGEAATLEPPLRFAIRPGVLRVRVARSHPGASPSAAIPEGFLGGARALARIAAGRAPEPPEPNP